MNKAIIKGIVSAMVAGCIVLSLGGCQTVKMANYDAGTARFVYEEQNIEAKLSESDLKFIAETFAGKKLYTDTPSCAFSENIAVIIDDKTFCVANDECGIIYIKEQDKYFSLSDDENLKTREILETYGFRFPCL